MVGSLFGSSHQLITGPTNAIALVTADVPVTATGRADFIEIVFALGFISGAIQLALDVLRLGGIIRFVSNSVLTRFLAGVSLLIILNQTSSPLG